MDLENGKSKFIQSWGTFASNWGINRTMAQVHALLLVSPDPLCAEKIMEELNISRGNANMNIRALIDWGLVYKEIKCGERREYFRAEKEMLEVFRRIVINRKKKELEPMLKVLDELSSVEGNCKESIAFCDTIKDLKLFSSKADSTLNRLINSDSSWFISTFMKMV